MKITKGCIYTNRKNTMEVNITEDQYERFKKGEDIDLVMPDITYEEREFLLTGALPEDLDDMYDDDWEQTDHHGGHDFEW